MKKFRIVLFVVLGIIVVLVLDILVAPVISARVATLPFVRKYDLFSPQAPIVITKREVVRADDSNGFVDSLNAVKSRLVSVVEVGGNKVISSGFVLTADGVVVTAGLNIKNEDLNKYRVVADDGSLYSIKKVVTDPATLISFVTSEMTNGAVAEFNKDAKFLAGQSVVIASHGPGKNSPRAVAGFVFRNAADLNDVQFDFDRPSGFVPVTVNSALTQGSVLIDDRGRIEAMWNGYTFVDSHTIDSVAGEYATIQNGFSRGATGFSYQLIRGLGSDSGSETVNLLVTQVNSSQLLLKVGDIILTVNDKQVGEYVSGNLFRFDVKPNQNLKFTVSRDSKNVDLVVKTGVFK